MWDRLKDFWEWFASVTRLADIASELVDHIKEILLIILSIGFLGFVVYQAVLLEIERSRKAPIAFPGSSEHPTIVFAPVVVMDNGIRVEWSSQSFAVEDRNNKKMEVAIGVLRGVKVGMLWDPFRWVLGSSSHVGIDGEESIKIEDAIGSAPEEETRPIIVVGMASHENSDKNPHQEEVRAGERADRLSNLCLERYPNADIYSLNLGFFEGQSDSSAASASERRVVLMVVTKQEDGADLTSGVRNALVEAAEAQDFSFDARNYSKFQEGSFRLWKRHTSRKPKTFLGRWQPVAPNTASQPDGYAAG